VIPAPNARTRALERVGVLAGIIGFAFLAVIMWHSARPTRWEKTIIRRVDAIPVPFRDFWISAFQPVAFAFVVLVVAGIVAVLGRRRLAGSGLAGCIGAVLAAEIVFKPLIDRTRTHAVGSHQRIVRVGSEMFPSAHVTAAAALAMFVWIALDRRPGLAPILALLPVVVGCSAIALQLHYPADVVAGALLGSAVVWCTVAVAERTAPNPTATTDTARAYDPVRTSR